MIPSAVIKRRRLVLSILILLIIVTSVYGMCSGEASLSFKRIIPVLFGDGTFKESFVLYSIRLPRIVITLLAGIALAASGTILQSITRNDLADPGIIGINSGAGVGIAEFFLYFPIKAGTFVYMLPIIAFIGACVTAVLIYVFAYKKNAGLQPIRLVLIGTGFSMALSGVMILLISSADRTKVDFIAKWLAGNIWGDDWPFILAMLPWLVVLLPFILYKAHQLNLLNLGEATAAGAGVAVEKERLLLLLAAVALAAAAVSVTGGIAFIGLMGPHMAKALVGTRHQFMLPIAMLLGGWLLLVADTIGRHLGSTDIPAGIITALIGGPYFIFLLLRRS